MHLKRILYFLLVLIFFSKATFAQVQIDFAFCRQAVQPEAVCTAEGAGPGTEACTNLVSNLESQCSEFRGFWPWLQFQWSKVADAEIDVIWTEIFAGLVLVLGGLAAWFRSQLGALRQRLADPLIKVQPKFESLATNVLFCGSGGCGKTSLVYAISGSDDANPSRASSVNRLYSVAHEVSVSLDDKKPSRRLTRLFLSDHIGQDAHSALETDFYKNPALSRLPKCLVIVVDIAAPGAVAADEVRLAAPDPLRVSHHLEHFSDAVIRILTAELGLDSKIILFINKIDALIGDTEENSLEAKELFRPLIERLSRIRGAELKVIVGSARTGRGVNGAVTEIGNGQSLGLYHELADSAALVA